MRFFGPNPALMVVEPEGLCWITGRMAGSRDGATWAREFARLPAPRAVVRDDGSGLGKGIGLDNRRRRGAGRPEFGQTLDVFPALREGGRALRQTWGVAARAWERAEVAREAFDRRGRRGRSCQGRGPGVNRLWREAEHPWDRAEAAESAWDRARSAFELFTPQGRLNDRAHAGAVVTAAWPELSDEAWAKTRRWLMRRESFTFPDQIGERLAGLGPDPGVLAALRDLEGLRRQPGRASAATRARASARTVQLNESSPDREEQALRVRAVLRGVWRASSLVECLDSVARMQRARHRKMTQGLLDLKRLYWDLRRSRTGHRKGKAPSGLLGLRLPEVSFGVFLELTPDELREQLPGQDVAS